MGTDRDRLNQEITREETRLAQLEEEASRLRGRLEQLRMRGYRAMGYRSTSFSPATSEDDYVIEYDPEALAQDDAELVL